MTLGFVLFLIPLDDRSGQSCETFLVSWRQGCIIKSFQNHFCWHPVDCEKLFLFSFTSRYFLISSFDFFSDLLVLNSMLFSLHVFILLPYLFLQLISVFIALWSEKVLDIISFLKFSEVCFVA